MSKRAPSSSGEERFWKLANPLLTQAGVTRSTMMGFPCLRLGEDFFASCDRRTGQLVIKLNEERATALIDAGRAEPFAPNGRRFREWVSIPERFGRSWPGLLDEALRCSAERRSAGRASRPMSSARTSNVRVKGQHAFDRVRKIALALPGVSERLSHGEPCFFVGQRRPFCYFHADHNGDGRISLWCPMLPGVQEEFVTAEPQRFFRPAPSASGTFATWLGVYLDTTGANRVDWNEISEILEDAYRCAAPKRLIKALEGARRLGADQGHFTSAKAVSPLRGDVVG
jgi:hypothetical protein